jgi:hypothetical protein
MPSRALAAAYVRRHDKELVSVSVRKSAAHKAKSRRRWVIAACNGEALFCRRTELAATWKYLQCITLCASVEPFICGESVGRLRRYLKVWEFTALSGSCGVWLDRFEKARFYASRRAREFLKLEAQTLIPATNIGYANRLTLDIQ